MKANLQQKLRRTPGILNIAMSSLVLGAAASTYAVPSIRIESGGSILAAVTDGGAQDANPGAGAVTYYGSVNSTWNLNITAGLSYPVIGSVVAPALDIESLSSSVGAGSLEIYFSDNNFGSSNLPNWLARVYANSRGSGIGAGASVTFETFYDLGNTLFATTTKVNDLGPFTESNLSTSELEALVGTLNAPYSVTLKMVITHTASATSGFNAALVTSIPEGGVTAIFLGLGVLSLGACARFRN